VMSNGTVSFDAVWKIWQSSPHSHSKQGAHLAILVDSCYAGCWVELARSRSLPITIQASAGVAETAIDGFFIPRFLKYVSDNTRFEADCIGVGQRPRAYSSLPPANRPFAILDQPPSSPRIGSGQDASFAAVVPLAPATFSSATTASSSLSSSLHPWPAKEEPLILGGSANTHSTTTSSTCTSPCGGSSTIGHFQLHLPGLLPLSATASSSSSAPEQADMLTVVAYKSHPQTS